LDIIGYPGDIADFVGVALIFVKEFEIIGLPN
jgi:hypothetical protein